MDVEEELRLAWAGVMSTRAGRHAVKSVLDRAGYKRQSFTPGQSDKSAFKEGQRSIALWLEDYLQAECWPQWVLMEEESVDRQVVAARELTDEDAGRSSWDDPGDDDATSDGSASRFGGIEG